MRTKVNFPATHSTVAAHPLYIRPPDRKYVPKKYRSTSKYEFINGRPDEDKRELPAARSAVATHPLYIPPTANKCYVSKKYRRTLKYELQMVAHNLKIKLYEDESEHSNDVCSSPPTPSAASLPLHPSAPHLFQKHEHENMEPQEYTFTRFCGANYYDSPHILFVCVPDLLWWARPLESGYPPPTDRDHGGVGSGSEGMEGGGRWEDTDEDVGYLDAEGVTGRDV